ncbi:phospholipid scramblase 1-like isoform X2 [Drosophila biarmipes]|uniref:phospholipid scramblase 1-like isoform X2 n=1 Tax=Drosophila biarmipes TaxID=125945 RepID=UPI0007E69C77|nr:phospholipid scramblase 1-like isoform X2 [Drosophila biarmipes]
MDSLSNLDIIFVNQQIDMQELFISFSSNRKYAVRGDPKAAPILYAVQDNKFRDRALKPNYFFTIKIMNSRMTEVMHVDSPRPDAYFTQPRIEVNAPPGNLIGIVKLHSMSCPRTLHILKPNQSKQEVEYVINAPGTCGGGNLYHVMDMKNKEVEKLFSGPFQELYTAADYFKVNCKGLDNRLKTILLGTVFFLDGLFYERSAARKILF